MFYLYDHGANALNANIANNQLGTIASPYQTAEGYYFKQQLSNAVTTYIESLPNKSAEQLAYEAGLGTVFVADLAIGSKGASFASRWAFDLIGMGARTAKHYYLGPKTIKAIEGANTSVKYLDHYTTKKGLDDILTSEELRASTTINEFGEGKYFTSLNPAKYKIREFCEKLHFNKVRTNSVKYFVRIDVTGLEVTEIRRGIYILPGPEPLPLKGRIISHGKASFKQ